MCTDRDIEIFAKELLRQPSKAAAYRAAFPEKCEGLSPEAISKRAWKLAEKGEVKAKFENFASAREKERREAFAGDVVELDEFRASLSRLFRDAVVSENVADAVKAGALLADVSGFRSPKKVKVGPLDKYDLTDEEVEEILGG